MNVSDHPAKSDDLLKLASDIVAAYVSNNSVSMGDLPSMIKSVHATLGGLASQSQFSDDASIVKT